MVLRDRGTIGTDVGVQEFTWMFDNKHSGDKTLKASVTIFFGSVRELLNEDYLRFIFTQNTIEEAVKQKNKDNYRKEGEKAKAHQELQARYSKMKFMFNPSTAINATKDEEEANYTQIKAVVGWSVPDIVGGNSLISEEFKKSIASTQKTIMLNFTKYDLTFGEEGQVKLKIDYVGSLDAVMIDDEKSDTSCGFSKSRMGLTLDPWAPSPASNLESASSNSLFGESGLDIAGVLGGETRPLLFRRNDIGIAAAAGCQMA